MCPSWSLPLAAGGSRGATGQARRPIARIAGLIIIIVVWLLGHLIGGNSGSMNRLNFFTESSTMGTILILVVAVAYSIVASRRDPELGERAGSIIADE